MAAHMTTTKRRTVSITAADDERGQAAMKKLLSALSGGNVSW